MKRTGTNAIHGNAPSEIAGIPVEANGEPMLLHGETWITMIPVNADDDRLWEYSLTTGRIVKTR